MTHLGLHVVMLVVLGHSEALVNVDQRCFVEADAATGGVHESSDAGLFASSDDGLGAFDVHLVADLLACANPRGRRVEDGVCAGALQRSSEVFLVIEIDGFELVALGVEALRQVKGSHSSLGELGLERLHEVVA